MKQLILYGTSGCHLCEQAAELLAYVLDENEFEIIEIDIAEADELLAAYGDKIPVLKPMGSAAELHWPFNEDMLDAFLS